MQQAYPVRCRTQRAMRGRRRCRTLPYDVLAGRIGREPMEAPSLGGGAARASAGRVALAPTLPPALDSQPARVRAAAALFSVALFVNAALLFTVEPMFTKMVLPLLGGTPAVWTTALLFFQLALLAGYLYAHFVAGRLGARGQAALHLRFLA